MPITPPASAVDHHAAPHNIYEYKPITVLPPITTLDQHFRAPRESIFVSVLATHMLSFVRLKLHRRTSRRIHIRVSYRRCVRRSLRRPVSAPTCLPMLVRIRQ
jgi:hypothetical protein